MVTNHMKRVLIAIAGGVVLLVGVALLVLPGPGLLLILAGLLILASEFPALERYVDPVRDRAMQAAEDSVSSPLRIAGSVCAGLGLLASGVVWGLWPELPFGGWSAGSSLILSGLILFALLIWSYRNVQARRAAREAAESEAAQDPVAGDQAARDQAARSEGRP